MNRSNFLDRLWTQYLSVAPQARAIHTMFSQHGDAVVNDHIAFRTIDTPGFNLMAVTECLESVGYQIFDHYTFPEKHLCAHALWIPDDPDAPKIFVSALARDVFPDHIESIIDTCIAPLAGSAITLEALIGHYPFVKPTWEQYEALAEVSEYAAWLFTMGYQANHFTVSVNHLDHYQSMEEVVSAVQSAGFGLNTVGGVLKGTPEQLLVQASTLADTQPFQFADGTVQDVPSCFYEFALRYPRGDGTLFQGFVPTNANAIFESTSRQR